MLFRVVDNKLYEIPAPRNFSIDKFLELNPDVIHVEEDRLPSIPSTEKRVFPKLYYKKDKQGNIVLDYERMEETWVEAKSKEISDYIFRWYPQTKQNSDLTDKLYYETYLKSKNVTNLEKEVTDLTIKFYNSPTPIGLDQLLSTLNLDKTSLEYKAYEQLLKVAIRVYWVQMCKEEFRKALDEKREPNYPEYPRI